MSTAARKIIVDSRYFLRGGTAESGTFELPEVITLYDKDVLYLQQFHCTVSWWTIDDSNDTMYLIEQSAIGAGLKTCRTIKIVHGPYDIDSFAAQLTLQMNDGAKTTVRGDYQIKKTTAGNFNEQNASSSLYRYFTFYLTGGGSFLLVDYNRLTSPQFYRDTWTALGGPAYDVSDPRRVNEIVNVNNGDGTLGTIWTTDLVDIRPKHALYMHCLDIGDGGSMGWNGMMRTCIAIMPCNVGFGSLLTFFGSGNAHDYIVPATRALKRLRLEIRDSRGHLVDFQGGRYICVFVVGRRPA